MQLTITGVEKVLHKLRTMEDIERHMSPPMEQSVELIRRTVAKQPRKAAGAFSAMATPAQKRAFWAKVRAEPRLFDERTGYRRTRVLANSWTSRVRVYPNGVEGVVGTNTPYAVYVHGMPGQQPFHAASGFVRVDEALERNQRKITNIFSMAISRLIEAP